MYNNPERKSQTVVNEKEGNLNYILSIGIKQKGDPKNYILTSIAGHYMNDKLSTSHIK